MPNRHPVLMTDSEVGFFKALGARVSRLRKDQGMTQSELAEPLGITQPMLASCEIGRRRIPASLLPALAHELRVSVGEAPKNGKPGPVPKLQKQLEAVSDLPKPQQQFVSQFLDTVLDQAAATASSS